MRSSLSSATTGYGVGQVKKLGPCKITSDRIWKGREWAEDFSGPLIDCGIVLCFVLSLSLLLNMF